MGQGRLCTGQSFCESPSLFPGFQTQNRSNRSKVCLIETCSVRIWCYKSCVDWWFMVTGWFTVILFCFFLWFTVIYCALLWFTVTYRDILYFTIFYYDLLWFTMIYYDLLWFTVIYHDLLWFTMIHYDLLWITIIYYGLLISIMIYRVSWFSVA